MSDKTLLAVVWGVDILLGLAVLYAAARFLLEWSH
jgi:hypothetical protein